MYARNNASPRPITIGAVVQISDGAVQATGVSVKVRKDAGSWATGAGTLAVEEGVWSYTPTQGETDCDALQIIIYKTSCIPNSMEVVFTDSSEFGQVVVASNNDKTGYSLASNGLASITSWSVAITGNITGNLSGSVGSVTGNVGGNVTGSVGSISGVTFPASFGTWTAPLTGSGTASAVWDALLASYTVAGSFGARVVRSVNSNNTIQLTGSNHAAADIHELQPAVIDNTHFAAGAIDANAIAADAIGASELAADAVTEIIAGMATQPQLVDLATMIVNDGTANARWSTSALQNAPSGGGGGGTGTGARTVAITVTLSAAPVEGASVRLTKAAETYVGTTNASGQITFNVDDGTWTVSITSPNATFAGASLVVDDNETVSYSLTAISITPSPAGQMTGYWTCYSHLGVVESGVSVTMQLVDVPKGSKGLALDSKLRTVTANGSGVAQFTNLFPGCRYKVYRGAADNKAFYVTLPEVAPADPVELGSFYGDDE